MKPGDRIELKVIPDPYVTVRYAGASGDFNPIHIDEEFARQVGLPGRILHGLWTMAQVARAATEAAGGPEALVSLSVQFRGMGRLGEEIVVSGEVTEPEADARPPGPALAGAEPSEADAPSPLTAKLEAHQGDQRIIRNARATLRPR